MQAQKSGDPLAMQQAILRQRMVYEKIGVSMGSMAVMPFVQLPVTLGMFFGVKKLCDLPLEQLKVSGFDILPDLTVADPTYTLPVICAVAMNAQLSLGMKDMAASPQAPHLINLFRVLSLAGVFFMSNLPSGVVVYLIASIGSLTLQTLILRIPAIRAKLGIPQISDKDANKSASFRDSLEYVKNWWNEKKQEEEQKRRRSTRRHAHIPEVLWASTKYGRKSDILLDLAIASVVDFAQAA
ncbi:hypothetical protein NLI96_g11745 [Meripilus lineatus]|uniref:Uncharacterized protein n=1 Tax=Meripilus lineatus TaxID=2056292 RepID=A0AAD5UR95_9APHY|nr:hypothetical protein NLI96_g11745 [Physisporinus lineatus]